jgi:NhaP-type Na+/H+ or K+/H+ antiporter
MANRVAGILALIAFAMCLVLGAYEAHNAFTTVVYRALLAMLGTYVVGYILGIAAEKMVTEDVVAAEQRLSSKKNPGTTEESATEGR